MNNLIIYVHGKGGSAQEAEHYISIFPEDKVVGFDYKSVTPWDAEKEFQNFFDSICEGYDKIYLIANSVGAFFAMHSLSERRIEKAFFISPVVNMEKLISDMLLWSNSNEDELKDKKEIPTSFGETLSWDYLVWVRNHRVVWNIPTDILYGSRDHLQSYETIDSFAKRFGAKITVMENGEHWFHTDEQMNFSDDWLNRVAR